MHNITTQGVDGSEGRPRDPIASERGAGLAEYALLGMLIALACIVALTALGVRISGMFNSITGMF